jgi:hypothetical protein
MLQRRLKDDKYKTVTLYTNIPDDVKYEYNAHLM